MTRSISFNMFLMLTLMIFWGSSFVVVKIALNEGLTPIAIATFRFLISGGLFLAAILVWLLSPVIIAVFSSKMFKENLMKQQIFGIGIAAVGTSLLSQVVL